MQAGAVAGRRVGKLSTGLKQRVNLARALIELGHEVSLIPTYTPIRTDETDVSIDRVFFGAINVYLEQKSALFRHTPWLVDRMLNGKRLLRWASGHGASVDARDLGELTLSMLRGEEGNQAKELEKLLKSKEYGAFASYNLGIAYLQGDLTNSAYNQLDRAGRFKAKNDADAASRDKANLVVDTLMHERDQ